MNKPILSVLAIASLCAINSLATSVTWTTSPGVSDTEVSTTGAQVFGYYFNSASVNPSVAIVNTVPFVLQSTAFAPSGLNFNGGYNNTEDVDLYRVPLGAGNAGLNQILDGQSWGGPVPLTVTGLTPGQAYQLQFMISDDRPVFFNNRNYDVSDSNDPEGLRDIERAYHSTGGGGLAPGALPGSVEAKIFTGTFTADATGIHDIFNWLYEGTDHTGGNSGSQVNAIQLRTTGAVSVPESGSTLLLLAGALGTLGWFKRRFRPARPHVI